jgi:hypothetical protein
MLSSAAFQPENRFRVISGGRSNDIVAFRRLEVLGSTSGWLASLTKRFEDVVSLMPGWDGYQGRPVSFSVAVFAANLLEAIYVETLDAPSIVPGADGSLQIEWHMFGFDIEVDILAPNNVVATRYRHADSTEEVVELKNDFSILADWIDELNNASRDHVQFARAM